MDEMPPAPPARHHGRQQRPTKQTVVEAGGAEWQKHQDSYEFLNLGAEQREEHRVRRLHERTQHALGGGWIGRERSQTTVRSFGRAEVKLEAVQQGLTEWELKKQRSRRALAELEDSGSPAPRSTSPTGRGMPREAVELALLSRASEFGLGDGRSYIAMTPSLSARLEQLKTPRMQPKFDALPGGPTPPTTAQSAPCRPMAASDALAEARAELARAEGRSGPSPALPAQVVSPPHAADTPQINPYNADGRFSYSNFKPQGVDTGLNLSGLSAQDMAKVRAAAEVLHNRFPTSVYLRPLLDQVRGFSI